jgi:hypothetical protein
MTELVKVADKFVRVAYSVIKLILFSLILSTFERYFSNLVEFIKVLKASFMAAPFEDLEVLNYENKIRELPTVEFR